MKRILPFAIFLMASCSNPNQYQVQPDGSIRYPEVVSENFSCPEDSMSLRCADLRGLGPIIIGKSTIHEISHLHIYDYYCGLDEKNIFEQWVPDYSICDDRDVEIDDVHCRIFRASDPVINEVKFRWISMEFYKGILVSMSFLPDKETMMKDSYIRKYGDGIGYLEKENFFYKDSRKDRYKTSERREWFNDNIILTYTYQFTSYPGQKPYCSSSFTLVDRSGLYDKYLEEKKLLIDKFKEKRKSNLEESYNSII